MNGTRCAVPLNRTLSAHGGNTDLTNSVMLKSKGFLRMGQGSGLIIAAKETDLRPVIFKINS
jgi:hypothetical protein